VGDAGALPVRFGAQLHHRVQLSAHAKGRVENAVGYVKKNLLAGLELPDLCAMQPAATVWVNTVADVRLHLHR